MTMLALVDFDDTLVETAPAFQMAREALFQRLREEGFPYEIARRTHYDEVDPILLAEHGMGPFRMEPSFRQTYLRLCDKAGRTPELPVEEACGALGRDFLGKPRMMNGSLGALESLARRIPTAIFSQSAQEEYQVGRIRDSGALGILGEERVVVVERKSPESFRHALRQFGVQNPASATMIGNSIRSDINPALTVGAAAILVEPYEMWEYDNVPPIHNDFLRFPSFVSAVRHLVGE
ncbi:MAG: HAD family hydrolase [Gemmatimonadota bacterium]|jgi:putative hydrolase of the HAD superfamily